MMIKNFLKAAIFSFTIAFVLFSLRILYELTPFLKFILFRRENGIGASAGGFAIGRGFIIVLLLIEISLFVFIFMRLERQEKKLK